MTMQIGLRLHDAKKLPLPEGNKVFFYVEGIKNHRREKDEKNRKTAVENVGKKRVRCKSLQGMLQIFLRCQVILVIDQYRRRGASPCF